PPATPQVLAAAGPPDPGRTTASAPATETKVPGADWLALFHPRNLPIRLVRNGHRRIEVRALDVHAPELRATEGERRPAGMATLKLEQRLGKRLLRPDGLDLERADREGLRHLPDQRVEAAVGAANAL